MTAATRILTVLGDPVEHSLSPLIQNAALAEAELDAIYVAFRCDGEDVPTLIRALARAGGAGNVTLPHKERAAAVVEEASEAVRRTGACNTFWSENGTLYGDNTDVQGFREALHVFRPTGVAGARVLLLGAGGAARAALVSLLDEGVGEVVILNRTLERARVMSRRIGGDRARVAESVSDLEDREFELVVNATRLGLRPEDPLPVALEKLEAVGGVMDLVYGRKETPFVLHARAAGIPAVDGREMLVRQGAASFARWWNRSAPLAAMRQVLDDGSEG